MKLVWFVAGAVAGAAAAVAYSVSTGRDLREEFADFRSDLSRGDLDALGSRLEARFTELQGQLETRMATVRDRAQAAGDTGISLDVAPDGAGDAVGDATQAAREVERNAAESFAASAEALSDPGAPVEATAEDPTQP